MSPADPTKPKFHFDKISFSITIYCLFIYIHFASKLVEPIVNIANWRLEFPIITGEKIIGFDFLNLWMYGVAAHNPDPGRYYDWTLYQQKLTEVTGGVFHDNWSYPPSMLLLMAPFGWLPYKGALLLWEGLSAGVWATQLRGFMHSRMALLLICISPASFLIIVYGQTTFLTAALLIGIFGLLEKRPILAGILIGCLTLKPQIGILIPVMLLASGRWRVIAVACLTTVALIGLTALLFGHDIWQQYYEIGLPTQSEIVAHADQILLSQMQTPFSFMRLLGADLHNALTVQGLCSLCAAALTFWAFLCRRHAEPTLLMAHFCVCSVVASPYLLSHDLMPLTILLVVMGFNNKLAKVEIWLTVLIYFMPVVNLYNVNFLQLPSIAVVLPVLMLVLSLKLYRLPAAQHFSLEKTMQPAAA